MKCIPKEGEPSFTILGSDPVAGFILRQWACERSKMATTRQEWDKIAEALKLAQHMDMYAKTPMNKDDANDIP